MSPCLRTVSVFYLTLGAPTRGSRKYRCPLRAAADERRAHCETLATPMFTPGVSTDEGILYGFGCAERLCWAWIRPIAPAPRAATSVVPGAHQELTRSRRADRDCAYGPDPGSTRYASSIQHPALCMDTERQWVSRHRPERCARTYRVVHERADHRRGVTQPRPLRRLHAGRTGVWLERSRVARRTAHPDAQRSERRLHAVYDQIVATACSLRRTGPTSGGIPGAGPGA